MKRLKTYLTIWFSTEGASPSEVTSALMQMGFKPIEGYYDFVYEWDTDEVEIDAILEIANLIHSTLKGMKVLFKLETVPKD